MKPFFSIVLPTYNRRHQLERCLKSIKNQDFKDFEIIIIDDGSNDGTKDFINTDHPDVRYYYQINQGVSKARNTGIENAKGAYIAFLDSDDIWYPSRLKIMHAVIEALPGEVGLIFNDMDRIVNGAGDGQSYSDDYFGIKRSDITKAMHQFPVVNISEDNLKICYGDIFAQLLHGNIISPPCTVMKKEVFTELGKFREDFRVANDSEYFLRVSKHYKIGYVPLILTSIDPPRSKVSLSASVNNIEKINNTIRIIDSYYQKEKNFFLKKQLKLRLSNLHGLLGYHHLSEYSGNMSRRHYKSALRLSPFKIRFLVMLYITLLPMGLLRFAAGVKQTFKNRR
ncbi:MAG: glycosyltransferase family 2 protein [Desulfobacteraceae bacterium]|jgi:glycosyltransferase involved in cell wall biosynthesis